MQSLFVSAGTNSLFEETRVCFTWTRIISEVHAFEKFISKWKTKCFCFPAQSFSVQQRSQFIASHFLSADVKRARVERGRKSLLKMHSFSIHHRLSLIIFLWYFFHIILPIQQFRIFRLIYRNAKTTVDEKAFPALFDNVALKSIQLPSHSRFNICLMRL